MVELTKGANAPLAAAGAVAVALTWSTAPAPLDVSCFLVGGDGRVPSDEHMVFYNQPRDPSGAVALSAAAAGRVDFAINLDALPAAVARCVFAATLDGAGTFAGVAGLALEARAAASGQAATYRVADATGERALIVGEVYHHASGWKVRAVGQGFNGGLKPLAESFGVSVADEPAAVAAPVTVAAQPPVLTTRLDLLKREVKVQLEKRRISGEKARVAAVVDATGSMSRLFKHGTVQRAFERVLAVAACLDDDGALDVWFFSDRPKRAPSVTERDLAGYVQRVHPKPSGPNHEPSVMRDVIQKYTREAPTPGLPTYVIFFSDGGVSAGKEIARILTDAARFPIFWQFVGLGNGKFGVLERLDTLPGRLVDNANFFALDDLDAISDAELYDRLLNEYPAWLKAARGAGVL